MWLGLGIDWIGNGLFVVLFDMLRAVVLTSETLSSCLIYISLRDLCGCPNSSLRDTPATIHIVRLLPSQIESLPPPRLPELCPRCIKIVSK